MNIPTKKIETDHLICILKTRNRNFIFMGDLNSQPNSYTIKKLQRHLVHCGPDFKQKTWATKPFNYRGFKEDELNWRIDYVFATKDIKVLSSKILKTPYSDHLPILTEIDMATLANNARK